MTSVPGGSDDTIPRAGARIRLDGIVLTDARSGVDMDLGAGPPLAILSVIRHRY